MKKPLIYLLLAFGIWSCNPQTSADPCAAFDASDLEMLTLIKQLNEKFKSDTKFKYRLDEAQVAWIQYRDRHLRTLYPEGYNAYRKEFGAEVLNPCKCLELDRLTKVRIAELKMWFEGSEQAQSDCPSTINQ